MFKKTLAAVLLTAVASTSLISNAQAHYYDEWHPEPVHVHEIDVQPDLEFIHDSLQFDHTSDLDGNTYTTVTIGLRNASNAAINTAFTVGAQLRYHKDSTIYYMQPWEETYVSFLWHHDDDLWAGDNPLNLYLDHSNTINEYNEDNNWLAQYIYIPPRHEINSLPDIWVRDLRIFQHTEFGMHECPMAVSDMPYYNECGLKEGDMVTIEATIRNESPTPTYSGFSTEIKLDGQSETLWVNPLNGYEEQVISISYYLQAPLDPIFNWENIDVNADFYNEIYESNEENNWAAGSIIVDGLELPQPSPYDMPDLEITNLAVSSNGFNRDDLYTFTVDVTNIQKESFYNDFEVSLYDGSVTTYHKIFGGLQGGETRTITFQMHINHWGSDQAKMLVTADASNNVQEIYEDNNEKYLRFFFNN